MNNNVSIIKIIEMLEIFISENDQSLDLARKIEVALDETFPDDDDVQDYVTCFASYRPGGGELLYDEASLSKESKDLLDILKGKL